MAPKAEPVDEAAVIQILAEMRKKSLNNNAIGTIGLGSNNNDALSSRIIKAEEELDTVIDDDNGQKVEEDNDPNDSDYHDEFECNQSPNQLNLASLPMINLNNVKKEKVFWPFLIADLVTVR